MGDSFYSDYDYYDYDDPHDDTQISWFSIAIGCVLFLIIIALAGFLVNALL